MSGHSKWASIKHKKAATDAKRGKLFTKLIKEITVAARIGGGDPDMNARLRSAIDDAKAANMPKSNIENAIKKGTGELPGVSYEEVTYEGYGPGGVALLIETTTDNKRRTVAELRHILEMHDGNLGETGCVGWMFDRVGLIRVPRDTITEDGIIGKALEAGAEDIKDDNDFWEVYSAMSDMHTVKDNLEGAGVEVESAEISALPQNTIKVEGRDAEKLLKMLNKLEDHDDVQNVYANFEIDDEVLEALGAED